MRNLLGGRSTRVASFMAVLIGVGGVPAFAASPVGKGELQCLSALPDKVVLRGGDSVQQLVITGHFANDGVRDLTHQVVWRVADSSIVRMETGGLLVVGRNGATEVIAEVQGKSVTV